MQSGICLGIPDADERSGARENLYGVLPEEKYEHGGLPLMLSFVEDPQDSGA